MLPRRPATETEGTGLDPQAIRLSERDFRRVSDRINNLAGIVLEPHKEQMVQSRLGRRLKATGLTSITDYLDLLDSGDGAGEVQHFIDTLTTNLTSFFREEHHFRHLAQNVLDRNRRAADPDLRIWSAGCSSGQEPYSIAMVAAERMGDSVGKLKILATDLDSNMLAKANQAVYPADKCDQPALQPYARFLTRSVDGRSMTVAPAARRLVTFRQLNLMQPWPMKGPFAAIFCRNVVIYFAPATKAALLDRFAALLRPDGFLYLGHSEAILGEHRYFRSLGNTIYQRKADGA